MWGDGSRRLAVNIAFRISVIGYRCLVVTQESTLTETNMLKVSGSSSGRVAELVVPSKNPPSNIFSKYGTFWQRIVLWILKSPDVLSSPTWISTISESANLETCQYRTVFRGMKHFTYSWTLDRKLSLSFDFGLPRGSIFLTNFTFSDELLFATKSALILWIDIVWEVGGWGK